MNIQISYAEKCKYPSSAKKREEHFNERIPHHQRACGEKLKENKDARVTEKIVKKNAGKNFVVIQVEKQV